MYIDISYADRLAELTLQARFGWSIAVISILLLALLSIRLSARFAANNNEAPRQRLRKLHRSNEATASMEYLMVLFPFLIIVMTVWQLAFMINARMHVGYATYAVARSAAVLIPAEMEGEKEGELAILSSDKVSKWTRIERAAIPGTIAISPGNGQSAAGVALANAVTSQGGFNPPQTPDALGTAARLTLMSMHMCDTPVFCEPQALTGTRPLRAAIKDYYAQNMTKITIQGIDHKQSQTLTGQAVIKVKVEFVYWLHVPWVGRMLEAAFKGFTNPVTGELIAINPYPSIILTEETSINTWFKQRATEPCT